MNRCSLTLLLCVARATGCAGTTTTTPTGVPIDPRHASVNQDSRVLFVVIHYTVADLAKSLKILTEAGAEVSAHYLISDDAKPVIYRLVPEDRRAWHSGRATGAATRCSTPVRSASRSCIPGSGCGPTPRASTCRSHPSRSTRWSRCSRTSSRTTASGPSAVPLHADAETAALLDVLVTP